MSAGEKIAIVTVHGTGDTAEGPDGQKWYQRGSQFTDALRQRLAGAGLDAEIEPVLWSGANSAADRENGADKLAKELKKLKGRYSSVHVLSHSHGGNVASDAAMFTRWGARGRKDLFDSLTTVGTPFFNLRTGVFQRAMGTLFLWLTWASLVLFPLIAVAMFVVPMDDRPPIEVALIYIFGVGACLFFMFGISRRGARRMNRPKRNDARAVLSIWHENDEAISFLRRVEELPIEAFPRGALYRGSRAAAISWGVLGVIVMGLVLPSLYVLGWFDAFGIDDSPSAGRAADTFAATAAGLVLAPAIFVLVYLAYRYIVGGVAEIGARRPLNGFVSGVLRGIAYGRDGDQVICNVSTDCHLYGTDSRKLDGEVAQRMQVAADAAADRLIAKYRWSLFTVGSDTNAPLADLARDAMTWDSLIHTTYFDQPEVVDMIAAHIAANAKSD